MHVALGDHGVFCCGWRCPAVGLPASDWHAVAKSAAHHEDKINQTHHDECLHHAHASRGSKIFHQVSRQRRANHGAATKTHDGHAGRHASAVWKPLDQRRHRADVAQTQADAANHA